MQRVVTEKDTAIARRGEDEFMVVAFMENARVDGEALMARVRDRISPHVAPRSVEQIDSLPMTATGKIRRRDLRGD